MKILAIEFSSDRRSVAVALDGIVRGSAVEQASRNTPAFKLIEQSLADAGVEREQIECLAIGLGPGSYTGIRSAIALAQGWQLALQVKLLGISSVECLAAEAKSRGHSGSVNILIDAQRNEFYHARYQVSEKESRQITPLKLAGLEELRSTFSAEEIIIGPHADNWFSQAKSLYPTASTLLRIAAGRSDFVPGDKLEPIYLRETAFVKAPPPRILPVD